MIRQTRVESRRGCPANGSLAGFPLEAGRKKVAGDFSFAFEGALPGAGPGGLESELLLSRNDDNRFTVGSFFLHCGEVSLKIARSHFHVRQCV